MLQPEKYSKEEIRNIQRACCCLFMSERAMQSVVVSDDRRAVLKYPFLEGLTYEEVKLAYRKNVFTYHPDRHQDEEPEDLGFYARHVEQMNRSYAVPLRRLRRAESRRPSGIGNPEPHHRRGWSQGRHR